MRKILSLLALIAGFALTAGAQPQAIGNQSWWTMESEPTSLANLENNGNYAIAFQTDEAGTLNFWHYPTNYGTSILIDESANFKDVGVITDASYVWTVYKYNSSNVIYLYKQNSSSTRIMMSQPSYNGGMTGVWLSTSSGDQGAYTPSEVTDNTGFEGAIKLESKKYPGNWLVTGSRKDNDSEPQLYGYGVGTQTSGDTEAAKAAAGCIRFYKVTQETNLKTFKISYNAYEASDGSGREIWDKTYEVKAPESFDLFGKILPQAIPSQMNHYYTLKADNNPYWEQYKYKISFSYKLVGDAPFKLSNGSTKNWYTLRLSSGDNRYLVREGDEAKGVSAASFAYTTDNVTSKEIFDNTLWAFVRSDFGVKLLNKGSGKYLTVSDSLYDDDGNKDLLLTSTGTVFYTVGSGESFALAYGTQTLTGKRPLIGYFHTSEYTGDECLYLSKDKYNGGTAADGAVLNLTLADDESVLSIGRKPVADELQKEWDDKGFNCTKDKDADENCLCREVNQDDATTLSNAISAAQNATTVSALDAAYAARGNVTTDAYVTPDTTAYYAICSVHFPYYKNEYGTSLSTYYMTTDKDGKPSDTYGRDVRTRTALKSNTSNSLVASLWRFEAADGGWKIVNANANSPLRNYASDSGQLVFPTDESEAGVYTLRTAYRANFGKSSYRTNDGLTMMQLVADGKALYFKDSKNIIGTTSLDADDDCNYWQVIKVTDIPVTVTDVGWATFCMPFPIKLPEDTKAVAYKGIRAAGRNLKLEEITGTIPAYTGFILALEGGGNLTLTISTDTDATIGTNVLSGTTAKRDGFPGADNYLLGKDGDDAVFLLAADDYTAVPMNKAYLPVSALETTTGTASAILNFEIDGGDTTGVSSAAQSGEERDAEYYDLSGRRVLYPANGIFVTKKGEKVLLR